MSRREIMSTAEQDAGERMSIVHSARNVFVAALLSAAMLLPNMAQAMEIRQYDKMASDDQAEYVADLVEGAEKVLTSIGNSDQAARVSKLFTTNLGNDKISIGSAEFNRNLALARVTDAERVAKDPNAHRLEVEDAMLVTLKKNNIPLPPEFIRGFRAINNGFQPKSPAQ